VSATTIAGLALVGVGIVLIAVLGLRAARDRRRHDNEGNDGDDGSAGDDRARAAELRARVERFKKRAPNPPPS
jgi:hypothetical protein